jgi:hypothetical protein
LLAGEAAVVELKELAAVDQFRTCLAAATGSIGVVSALDGEK